MAGRECMFDRTLLASFELDKSIAEAFLRLPLESFMLSIEDCRDVGAEWVEAALAAVTADLVGFKGGRGREEEEVSDFAAATGDVGADSPDSLRLC